jgi:hypothetical protein
MKKIENLNNSKFRLGSRVMEKIVSGNKNGGENTGECHGTGCNWNTGSNIIIDWEDIECGTENIPGSPCPYGGMA